MLKFLRVKFDTSNFMRTISNFRRDQPTQYFTRRILQTTFTCQILRVNFACEILCVKYSIGGFDI